MFKYWVKNRAWITFFEMTCLCLAICLLFIIPNINNRSNNYSKQSIYINAKMDYDIPAPTKDQLQEIENLSFVNSVFGYYYTETTALINNSQKVNTKIIFSDYTDNIDLTMYSKNRLIESSKKACENPIYIDFEYKSKNKVANQEGLIDE